MARQSRIVVAGVVHHAVARGVNRTRIFRSGYDKGRYLKRAAAIAAEVKILIHGYCLMENHVHFLLTPTTADGLSQFFKRLHTWWAMYFNKKQDRTGHLFQCRYFSSPLSECHYWTALRYVELNSVRAKLVRNPEDWPWSSARTHLQPTLRPFIPLTTVLSRAANTPSEWREILQESPPSGNCEADERLRRAYRSSKPCGPAAFIRQLEEKYGRRLASRAIPLAIQQLSA